MSASSKRSPADEPKSPSTLMDEFDSSLDMPLDPGIRAYVLALRQGGVETFESCQGGEGHAFPEPTIRFYGSMAAGFKAYGVAVERGLPVSELRLVYPANEYMLLTGPWWQMTFVTPWPPEITALA